MFKFFDKMNHAESACIGLLVGYAGRKLCNSNVGAKRHGKAVKQFTQEEQAARDDEVAGMYFLSPGSRGK